MDCEGVPPSGPLTMVQIGVPPGTDSEHAFLFDLVMGKETDNYRVMVELLREILEDPRKEKIFHDCRWDALQLSTELGIHLKNVIDTQVEIICFGQN